MERTMEVLEQRLDRLEREIEENGERHRDFFARFEKMKEAQVRTEVQYANILGALTKMERAIEEIKGRPARRWEAAVNAALQWIVVAVLAAVVILN